MVQDIAFNPKQCSDLFIAIGYIVQKSSIHDTNSHHSMKLENENL